jgi:hypothetical protein
MPRIKKPKQEPFKGVGVESQFNPDFHNVFTGWDLTIKTL